MCRHRRHWFHWQINHREQPSPYCSCVCVNRCEVCKAGNTWCSATTQQLHRYSHDQQMCMFKGTPPSVTSRGQNQTGVPQGSERPQQNTSSNNAVIHMQVFNEVRTVKEPSWILKGPSEVTSYTDVVTPAPFLCVKVMPQRWLCMGYKDWPNNNGQKHKCLACVRLRFCLIHTPSVYKA